MSLRPFFLIIIFVWFFALIFLIFRLWSVLEQARFDNLIKQGNQAFGQKDYTLAQNSYQEAQRLRNDLPVKAQFNLGQIAFEQGQLEVAQSYFQQVLVRDSSLLPAHHFLALIFSVSDLEAAIKELTLIELQDEKAQSLKTKLQKAYTLSNSVYQKTQVGFILLEENQPFLAVQVLTKVVAEKPDYRDGHLLLGTADLKLGEFAQAEMALQKAADLDPNYAATFDLLGKLYEAWGKSDSAQKNFERAEKLKR